MSEHAAPRPSVVEVLLFAPLGALLALREHAPEWAVQGRAKAETRIRVARMIGEFAVKTGVKEIERRIAGRFPARDESDGADGKTHTESTSTEVSSTGVATTGSAGAVSSTPVGGSGSVETAAPAPPVSSLPIPSYDSLAASQVVERLDALSADELDLVRAYEVAGRHRQTVLHRIDRLRGA